MSVWRPTKCSDSTGKFDGHSVGDVSLTVPSGRSMKIGTSWFGSARDPTPAPMSFSFSDSLKPVVPGVWFFGIEATAFCPASKANFTVLPPASARYRWRVNFTAAWSSNFADD